MLAHKLVLDAVVDQPFKLIAIHCSLEEYKLAFLLNKHLDLRLSRARNDIDLYIKSVRALFSLYEYKDQQKYCDYFLVSNKYKGLSKKTTEGFGSLFGEEEMASETTHLLPEYAKVDFFLKLEEESGLVSEVLLLDKIKQIPQIATAYCVATENIKSKENLIFD
ncbi:IPExxxVDY family protein [Salinimicrobium sp. GXAS 041]|uniref:IPExxxVDY family protein n=1 Tax=Salinimicrobium sp. GXAS 041 TaxID=3400806 RepID=UPI003C758125